MNIADEGNNVEQILEDYLKQLELDKKQRLDAEKDLSAHGIVDFAVAARVLSDSTDRYGRNVTQLKNITFDAIAQITENSVLTKKNRKQSKRRQVMFDGAIDDLNYLAYPLIPLKPKAPVQRAKKSFQKLLFPIVTKPSHDTNPDDSCDKYIYSSVLPYPLLPKDGDRPSLPLNETKTVQFAYMHDLGFLRMDQTSLKMLNIPGVSTSNERVQTPSRRGTGQEMTAWQSIARPASDFPSLRGPDRTEHRLSIPAMETAGPAQRVSIPQQTLVDPIDDMYRHEDIYKLTGTNKAPTARTRLTVKIEGLTDDLEAMATNGALSEHLVYGLSQEMVEICYLLEMDDYERVRFGVNRDCLVPQLFDKEDRKNRWSSYMTYFTGKNQKEATHYGLMDNMVSLLNELIREYGLNQTCEFITGISNCDHKHIYIYSPASVDLINYMFRGAVEPKILCKVMDKLNSKSRGDQKKSKLNPQLSCYRSKAWPVLGIRHIRTKPRLYLPRIYSHLCIDHIYKRIGMNKPKNMKYDQTIKSIEMSQGSPDNRNDMTPYDEPEMDIEMDMVPDIEDHTEADQLDDDVKKEMKLREQIESLVQTVVYNHFKDTDDENEEDDDGVLREDMANQIRITNESRKRLQEWNKKVPEFLASLEAEREFDIRSAKQYIVKQIDNQDRSFKDVVSGGDYKNIARSFLTTLLMATKGNIDLQHEDQNTIKDSLTIKNGIMEFQMRMGANEDLSEESVHEEVKPRKRKINKVK